VSRYSDAMKKYGPIGPSESAAGVCPDGYGKPAVLVFHSRACSGCGPALVPLGTRIGRGGAVPRVEARVVKRRGPLIRKKRGYYTQGFDLIFHRLVQNGRQSASVRELGFSERESLHQGKSSAGKVLVSSVLLEQWVCEGIIAPGYGTDPWHEVRAIRDPVAHRRRRHGRSVSRQRHKATASSSD